MNLAAAFIESVGKQKNNPALFYGEKEFSYAELYAQTVVAARKLAEEKGVALRIAPAGATMIDGNRSLISQALANLVDNAIKYTPAGGKVRIRAANTNAGVELSVTDSGPGIPSADRPRVTERFVRLEASRSSPGTGLGLSLVMAVAHFHRAELVLEDNVPTGLKAVLRFPKSAIRSIPPLKNAAE